MGVEHQTIDAMHSPVLYTFHIHDLTRLLIRLTKRKGVRRDSDSLTFFQITSLSSSGNVHFFRYFIHDFRPLASQCIVVRLHVD